MYLLYYVLCTWYGVLRMHRERIKWSVCEESTLQWRSCQDPLWSGLQWRVRAQNVSEAICKVFLREIGRIRFETRVRQLFTKPTVSRANSWGETARLRLEDLWPQGRARVSSSTNRRGARKAREMAEEGRPPEMHVVDCPSQASHENSAEAASKATPRVMKPLPLN